MFSLLAKEKIVNPYDKNALVKEKEKPIMTVDLAFGVDVDVNLFKTNYKLNETEEFAIWRANKGEEKKCNDGFCDRRKNILSVFLKLDNKINQVTMIESPIPVSTLPKKPEFEFDLI